MLIRLFFFSLIIFFASFTNSAFCQNCSCKVNFDSLRVGVESNYVGYNKKVSGSRIIDYNKLVDSINSKIYSADKYNCYLLLKNYISFFKDYHLQINIVNPSNPQYLDSLKNVFSVFNVPKYDSVSIYNYLESAKLDPIEGIWKAENFPFEMAITYVPSKGYYSGIATKTDEIRWHRGQEKVQISKKGDSYDFIFLKGDHLPARYNASVVDNVFEVSDFGSFRRIFPGKQGVVNNDQPISFKKLSDSTCLITIRSCWISYRKILDSLVGGNQEVISHSPNLILDLRDNYGGHIMTLDTLIPLIYTNTIYADGLILRASRENINLYREVLDEDGYSTSEMDAFKDIIGKMEKHEGEYVQISDSDSIYLSKVAVYPRKVGILMNRWTRSAAELFILESKQSRKVTLFGENSKGQLDYTEIARPRKLPCPYFEYNCPMGTGTHKYQPYIDNVGIEPDKKIINSTDWIKFAQNELEGKNKK